MRTTTSVEPNRGFIEMCAFIAGSLLLGYFVPHFNSKWVPWLAAPLGKDQIIAFLSALSSGMIAFTGIVFSLLLVLLQFGTTAYTPRIVGVWVRNRSLSNSGGVFVATFLYSLMALRGVDDMHGSASSALALWVAFAWLLGSVFMLLRLIQMFGSLSHTNVLYLLGDMGQSAVDRIGAPASTATISSSSPCQRGSVAGPSDPPSQTVLHVGKPLYVRALDVARIVALAEECAAVVHLPCSIGDAVTAGSALAYVHASGRVVPEQSLREAISLGRERLLEHDPKYALRLLVDIAIRALSPAICDPTTAVQALDQIESLLKGIGNARLDSEEVRDASGALRLVVEATTWPEYLELGLAEIQQYGADSLQVERRLGALVDFLWAHVPETRRADVERVALRRFATVHETFTSLVPRASAERSDRQGLGHTARLLRQPRLPAS
ncbi:MAG: DUF2254 domain-containing protein [Polyangiaceae bacterium]